MSHCRANRPATVVANRASQRFINVAHSSAIGVDVHLDLLVCAYQYHQDNQIITEIQEFGTGFSQIEAFAQWCDERTPEIVIMESTGVLWNSPYEALEHHGFDAQRLALVNARDVKAAMGRKTDREDAARLAEFGRIGRLKRSFIPPPVFRQMRIIARLCQKAKADISRKSNRFQKLLNACGCRASTVFSDVANGKAARLILDAFINQDPNFRAIVEKSSKKLAASADEIIDALNFTVPPAFMEQIREERYQLDLLEKYYAATMARRKELQAPFEAHIQVLCTIPGIKETSARLIFAELSDDLALNFENGEHFASWLGICPGNHLSAGKSYSSKTPKGNKALRKVLTECAHGIALSRKGALYEQFKAIQLRRGTRRAIVAIAHKLTLIIYSCLTSGECYVERETSVLRDACRTRLAKAKRLASKYAVNEETADYVPAILPKRSKGAPVGRVTC